MHRAARARTLSHLFVTTGRMLKFRPRTDRLAGRQRKHDPSVRIPFGACRRATYAVLSPVQNWPAHGLAPDTQPARRRPSAHDARAANQRQ